MADLNYDVAPDQDPATTKLNISPWGAWLGIAFRQASIMGGAIASLYAYLSQHDIRGLMAYFGTHEFIVAVLMILGFAATAWGYVREWLHKRKLMLMRVLKPAQVILQGKLPLLRAVEKVAPVVPPEQQGRLL